MGGNQRSDQGLVVDIAAASDEHLALPPRLDKVFIGGDLTLLHPVPGPQDDPRPLGKTEPFTLGMPQVLRNQPGKKRRLYRLENSRQFGLVQPARVYRDKHISWTAFSFAFEPFQHGARAALDEVDLDTGFLLELPVDLIVGVVMPR